MRRRGRDIAEGLEAAKLLVQYGYDALDTDVGTYDAWCGIIRRCTRRRDSSAPTARW